MFLYLIVLLAVISVPFALSFEKNLKLYKRWKYLLPGILITMLLFIVWDIIFTHLGYWVFNPIYNSGIELLKLPLEEYFFFISIPYACAFTYYAIQFHFPKYHTGNKPTVILSIILIIAALGIALSNRQHIYTFVNFNVMALILLVSLLSAKQVLKYYLAIFPILFIPFVIVSSILTGTGIEQEVYKYDPTVITGIRIFTIPIEDMFYAFSLILLVLVFTHILENKTKRKVRA